MYSGCRPLRIFVSRLVGSLGAASAFAQEGAPAPLSPSTFKYDLILAGGHALDAKNHRDGMMDADSSGWHSFPDFRQRVIDRSQARVLAFLNIVGAGI